MEARLYDGQSARVIAVRLEVDAAMLQVSRDGVAEAIALAGLRRGVCDAAGLTLHRVDQPDWRLVLPAPTIPAWTLGLARVGALPLRARAAYLAAALGVAVIVAGVYGFGGGFLAAAAPLVPHRVTEPIGRSFVAQFGRACDAPPGRAVLDRLTNRLKPVGGFAEPVTVTVVDVDVVNAVALPGGHVVVFRRLLDRAQSGDEVAGVLAHELAHVEYRHPNQALIRQMGISLLARSIGGDAGGAVDLALLLQGSRAAEAQADDGAIATLRRLGISPAPMAGFFDREVREARSARSGWLARLGDYAATHPADAARSKLFRSAAITGADPALSIAEWRALKTICQK